jgi:hypothetical protein
VAAVIVSLFFKKLTILMFFILFFDCSYMAVQYHVAFSGSLRGAGVIAAGPYWCTLSKQVEPSDSTHNSSISAVHRY